TKYDRNDEENNFIKGQDAYKATMKRILTLLDTCHEDRRKMLNVPETDDSPFGFSNRFTFS
ncbi:unnamed protein product, partial [Larinioides sclopetarius]